MGKSPLRHASEEDAVQTIDAMLFSGDPSETPEKLEYLTSMVDRWKRRLTEAAEQNEQYENENRSN